MLYHCSGMHFKASEIKRSPGVTITKFDEFILIFAQFLATNPLVQSEFGFEQ
jgi:hypothetical protein